MKSIKKTLCLFLTMLMLISAITPVMASDNINVRLGGELIKFDVQPQLINDRTMVPLRAIFEALGATVDWNGDTQTVTSTKGDTTISLTINNPTMYVNGESVTLDSPACLVDGRTLVPVRAISEAFKLKVEWIGETNTVKIKTKVSVPTQYFNPFGGENGTGITFYYTYDDNGNLILTTSDIGWEKYSYDANGNEIYYTDHTGVWKKSTYNSQDKIIYSETDKGIKTNYTYNENNDLILEDSGKMWIQYAYNDKHQLISKKYSYDYWEKYSYNENGKMISSENSIGETLDYNYDEKGNLISNTNYTYEYIYDNEGFISKCICKSNAGITVSEVIYNVIEK